MAKLHIKRGPRAGIRIVAALATTLALVVVAGPVTAAETGSRLWVQRFDGGKADDASSMAVSPDGSTVFVAGQSNGFYTTIAYRAATGAELWIAGGAIAGRANSIAVAPGGATVFVTGAANAVHGGLDIATVAYDAATGATRWVSRHGDGAGYQIAASSRGVFVTGFLGTKSGSEVGTLGYNGATGAQLWAGRDNGGGIDSWGKALTVSPSGRTVFVSGVVETSDQAGSFGYLTIAYRAGTGVRLWSERYGGRSESASGGNAITMSQNGATVYVAGGSIELRQPQGYGILAYQASTGRQLWVSRYEGPGHGYDEASSIVVAGADVVVTGESSGGPITGSDYATVAVRASTGTRLWAERYNGPANGTDIAKMVAVSRNGGIVYATGTSAGSTSTQDYATIAYQVATGARLWVGRYVSPTRGKSDVRSVAVNPRTGAVYVTGTSFGTAASRIDFATVAYRG